jgi:alanyl aminopeptidase
VTRRRPGLTPRRAIARAGVLAAVALAACHPPAAAPPTPPPPPPPVVTDDAPPAGRLDDRAQPTAATVELEVDPRADDVAGRVAIDVAIARPLRIVWLHARGLAFTDARVIDAAGVARPARIVDDPHPDAHHDGQGELIGVAVEEPLAPGAARLELAYRAGWGAQAGLLRSTAVGPMAVTDLSPADARSVMPCFDDPRFKIRWTLALTIPRGLAAFANYPERARTDAGGGRVKVEFEPTRPLPAHLLAFAVGELVTVDAGRAPVPMRIITVAGAEPAMAHAAAHLGPLLARLSAYVDEPVPFPKLDVVAVPALSGSVVGMENPGLITVRADGLMVPPGAPPWVATAVTSTLVHELAHLWFGDLVSLAWWDEFWLNEGFATWLTDKVMAEREPGWTLVGHPFAPWIMMSQDPPGGAPVRRPLRELADYPRILDLKAYARGAAAVATLEAWLGPDRFRDLVRRWIDHHRDGSVTTRMLADAIAAAAAIDPAEARAVLSALVDQSGVPEARLALRCAAGAPPALELDVRHGGDDERATVPVCVRYDGGPAPLCALASRPTRVPLPVDRCPAWIVANPGARAYYRPVLAPGLWAAAFADGGLSADERALYTRAVDDRRPAMTLDDRLRVAVACDLDDLPWCRGELEPLVRHVVTAARRPALLARLAPMLPASAVGFDRGDGRARLLAAQRGLLLAGLGDRAAARAARAPALALLRDRAGSDLWYASAVLGAAAAGDPSLWPRYLERARAKGDPMAAAFAAGLGGFQDRRALRRLEAFVADREVESRLRRRALAAAFANPALREQRRALAARAAPLLSPSELEAELATWCGADDEAAAAGLLRSRGASDEQVERALERIAACTALAADLAADASSLDP